MALISNIDTPSCAPKRHSYQVIPANWGTADGVQNLVGQVIFESARNFVGVEVYDTPPVCLYNT